MKVQLLVSIFLVLHIASFYDVNGYGILSEIEEKFYDVIDGTYLKKFIDLLDPRKIAGMIYKTAGQRAHRAMKIVGGNNEILRQATATVPELIEMHGYPVEIHDITTEDGFIIQLHRIPNGRFGRQVDKLGVVLIEHGVLCSSACWVFLGPGRALGYILADMGYDVWLGNIRGNTYGRKHRRLSVRDHRFWLWTFHEVGIYDIPASIDYILQVTGEPKLHLIAHSLTTTSCYVMLSERPEYNNKLRSFINMSPAAYFRGAKSPILYFLAHFVGVWDKLLHLLGYNEFLPHTSLLMRLGGSSCSVDPINQLLCANEIFVFNGFNRKNLNETLLPIIFGHAPAGTSLRTMIHYGQLFRNFRNRFQYFSHGFANLMKYGSPFPPAYKLFQITAPTFLFYGRNDWVCPEKNVLRLSGELPNLIDKFVTSDPEWNHFDFCIGNTAKEEVYDKIIDILGNY